MRRFTTFLAFAAACATSAAMAQSPPASWPVEEKRLASGKQTLDPSMGSVFMHGPERLTLTLIKVPTAEDVARHEAERRRLFAEAQAEYAERLRRWERDREATVEAGRSWKHERPVEPTDESFSIGTLEQQMVISFGPQFVYAKGDGYYSYLQELEPGTYVYYGSLATHARGWLVGTCMCMGTVTFEVVAGRITKLGDFPTMRWVTEEQARASDVQLVAQVPPVPVDFTLPERLAAMPHAEPEWRAFGKINNLLGVVVGRMPPLPGVLAYDRDAIIDLRASQGAAGAGGS